MELIKDQHKSPALLRYADRITENRFDSNGGFNLAGGIADARWVLLLLVSSLSSFPLLPSFVFYLVLEQGVIRDDHVYSLARSWRFILPQFSSLAPAWL